jgi:hypothetical protein
MRVFIFAGIFAVAVCASAVSVSAQTWQDNKIRVIQEDGSVVEVEIPATPPPPEDVARPAPPVTPQRFEPPEIPAIAPIHAEDVAAPLPPAMMEEPPARSTPVSAPIDDRPRGLLVPGRKPPAPVDPRQYWPSSTPTVAPGAEITKELALQIAMQDAPPARSVNVVPRTYQGQQVFVVQFRTEDGLQEVLVDRTHGNIIKPVE